MTRQQIMLRSAEDDSRRRLLLENHDFLSRGGLRRRSLSAVQDRSGYSAREVERRARLAELAGGTTAECAAVACCCPCGIVDLLVLAAYKVPAGLCRKALRRRHRRRMQKSSDVVGARKCCCCDDLLVEIHPITNPLAMINALDSDNNEVIELEKEMWDRFYGAGFWRSPSQRSDISYSDHRD